MSADTLAAKTVQRRKEGLNKPCVEKERVLVSISLLKREVSVRSIMRSTRVTYSGDLQSSTSDHLQKHVILAVERLVGGGQAGRLLLDSLIVWGKSGK